MFLRPELEQARLHTDISILSTLGFYKLKHIYKHIFTVKNGKTLSISTVRSFQRYAYKKNCIFSVSEKTTFENQSKYSGPLKLHTAAALNVNVIHYSECF